MMRMRFKRNSLTVHGAEAAVEEAPHEAERQHILVVEEYAQQEVAIRTRSQKEKDALLAAVLVQQQAAAVGWGEQYGAMAQTLGAYTCTIAVVAVRDRW